MLLQAEQEAKARGCRGAWLDTYSFQARGFYERLGYAVFGALTTTRRVRVVSFCIKPLSRKTRPTNDFLRARKLAAIQSIFVNECSEVVFFFCPRLHAPAFRDGFQLYHSWPTPITSQPPTITMAGNSQDRRLPVLAQCEELVGGSNRRFPGKKRTCNR
jgi:hypothetical protein